MRRTARIIVCLFIGAAMTVGVAWLCALLAESFPRDQATVTRPGTVPAEWPYWSDSSVALLRGPGNKAEYKEWHRTLVTVWMLSVGDGTVSHSQVVMGFGLPFRAMWRGVWHWESPDVQGMYSAEGYIGGYAPDRSNRQLRLPLMPLFGFMFNTLFYAAITYGLWSSLATAIAWRRLSRGMCPNCKYALGPSPVCTECGTKIPGRAVP